MSRGSSYDTNGQMPSPSRGGFDLDTVDRSVLIDMLLTAKDEREELLEKLNSHQNTISQLTTDESQLAKQSKHLQLQLDAALQHQARVETELNERQSQVDSLSVQVKELTSKRREAEKRLREEEESYDSQKTSWLETERELTRQVKSLTTGAGLSPRVDKNRGLGIKGADTEGLVASPSTPGEYKSAESSPNTAAGNGFVFDAAAAQVAADEIETLQHTLSARDKTIKLLEKQISETKKEVAGVKEDHQDMFMTNMRLNGRVKDLENEIRDIKGMNEQLMEDNESYQVLLHERTMTGDFLMNPIMQDNITEAAPKKPSNGASSTGGGFNLAAELDRANAPAPAAAPSSPTTSTTSTAVGTGESLSAKDDKIFRLEEELRQSKDSNKALSLYVSKIIDRIIAHKGFETVLAADYNPERAAQDIPEEEAEPDPKINRRRTIGHFRNVSEGGISLFGGKEIGGKEAANVAGARKPAAANAAVSSGKMKPLLLAERAAKTSPMIPEESSFSSVTDTPTSTNSSSYGTPEPADSTPVKLWRRASLQYGRSPRAKREPSPLPSEQSQSTQTTAQTTANWIPQTPSRPPPQPSHTSTRSASGFIPPSPASPTSGVGGGFVGDGVQGGWRKAMNRMTWMGWVSGGDAPSEEDKYTSMSKPAPMSNDDGVE